MPRVAFTPQLRRFVDAPEVQCAADVATLRDALAVAFDQHPRVRAYVLDDQGHLRPNVIVFIDGQRSTDRTGLGDAVKPDSRIYVLQALSGG